MYPKQEEGRLVHECGWKTLVVVVVVVGRDVLVVDVLEMDDECGQWQE